MLILDCIIPDVELLFPIYKQMDYMQSGCITYLSFF